MQPLTLSRLKRLGMIGGALLTALVGAALIPWSLDGVTWKLGEDLASRSYDLPFRWRSEISLPEVIVVYLDAKTQDIHGPEGGAWERRLYTRLLNRLHEEKASLVVFDMFFGREKDPAGDLQLAEAMRRHGNVVIGSLAEETLHQTGAGASADQRTVKLPLPLFRDASRATGLIMLEQQAVHRRLYPGTAELPAIHYVAAALATTNASLALSGRVGERWLNYYGPAYSLRSVSLSEAVSPEGTPPGFFRGRTVFVGGHPTLFPSEQFQTPFSTKRFSGSRFERSWSSGVEILATGFANLVRHESITPLPWPGQLALVVLWGILSGAGLMLMRPWHAAWVTVVAAFVLVLVSFQLQWQRPLTWAWMVPVTVQLPFALVWSVGYQYAVEGRQRRHLIRAFGAYLSPHVVRRIAASEIDVAPGGHEVEATILFTDLEGFTAIAEKLPPREVSQLLIAYFNETTQSIWAHEGTIIKYIGDSVMAGWGAPLPEARHAERAVLAACGIIEAGRKPILGRQLRTRIGINTGTALAGNLGSKFRFDYTIIGATTNLASRLEGMNQRLGTSILISEATRRDLGDSIRLRRLGRFLVKGITEPFRAYEVLGSASGAVPAWLPVFEQGIESMERRAWSECAALFCRTIALRDGRDGPSEFYLEWMKSWPARTPSGEPDWDGIAGLDR